MAKQNKTKWDALSMKDRASFIKIGIKNGFTDLEEIRKFYNEESDLLNYDRYIQSLPDNHKFTSESKFRGYKYWKLNGKPKDFEEAKSKGMYNWDKSDQSYHANSVAWDDRTDIGHFVKPKTHESVKYELDWYNKGLKTLDGGEQVPLEGEEKEFNEEFRRKYKLDDSLIDYRYIPKTKEEIEYEAYLEEQNKDKPIDLDELKRRQAWTETRGDDNAVSPKGAKGRYQIMPNVLKEYEEKTGDKGDIFDSKYNEKVRDWQIKRIQQSRTVNNNNPTDSVLWGKTMAAYNWGIGNLGDALVEAKNDNIDIYNTFDWINPKYLPRETIDYVNFILRNKDSGAHRTNEQYNNRKASYATGGELEGLEGLPVFMYRPEYIQQAAQDYITDNQVFGDYDIPEVEVSRKGKKLPSVNSKEGKERIKFLAQRIANGDSTLDAVPTKYKKNVKRYLSGIEFGKEVAKREGYEGLQAFATAAPLAAVPGIFSTMAAATPSASAVINPSSLMNPITKGQLAKQLALDMGWGTTGYEGTNKLSEWITGKPFNQAAYDQITSGLSPEDIEMNREWGEAVLDMANPGGWLGLNNAGKLIDKATDIRLPHVKYTKENARLRKYKSDLDKELDETYSLLTKTDKQLAFIYSKSLSGRHPLGKHLRPHTTYYKPLHSNNVNLINRSYPELLASRIDDRTVLVSPKTSLIKTEDGINIPAWGSSPKFKTSRPDIPETIPQTELINAGEGTTSLKLSYPKKGKGGQPKIEIIRNEQLFDAENIPVEQYVTLPESVRQIIGEEMNSALTALGTKSGDVKVFGSSAPAQKGFLPHIPDDVDVITTRRTYDERISRLPLYDKDSRTAKHHQYTFSGTTRKVDVNIIEQDAAGMATGELATQLFWKEFPEEFWKQARIAAEKGIPMRITKTPEELLEAFDPVEDTILDAFISKKSKHISRVSTYLEQGDLATMQRVIQRKGKLLYGEHYVPLNDALNYSDYDSNLRFLSEIGYRGISPKTVARNPERMALIMEEFYQSLGATRFITADGDNIDEALTKWWKDPSGKKSRGAAAGSGLNTIGIRQIEDFGWSGNVRGIIHANIGRYIKGKTPLEALQYMKMLDVDNGIPLPKEVQTIAQQVISKYTDLKSPILSIADLDTVLKSLYTKLDAVTFNSLSDEFYNILPYVKTNKHYQEYMGFLSSPASHVAIGANEGAFRTISPGYYTTGHRGDYSFTSRVASIDEETKPKEHINKYIGPTFKETLDKRIGDIKAKIGMLESLSEKTAHDISMSRAMEEDLMKYEIITGIIAGMLGIGYTGYKMYDNLKDIKTRRKNDLEQK